MNQAGIQLDVMLVPDDQAAEVEEPAVRPLDLPTALVAAKLAPILVRRHRVIAPARDDRLDSTPCQALPDGVAVIPTVADQSVRVLARAAWVVRSPDRDCVERLADELDLRRGRRVQVNSDRSTRAIGQYHELRSLAPLGRADAPAPLF